MGRDDIDRHGRRIGYEHGVYLRWKDGPDATFLVLSQNRPTSSEAINLNRVGIPHFTFWVDDLEETFEKVKTAGIPILVRMRMLIHDGSVGQHGVTHLDQLGMGVA